MKILVTTVALLAVLFGFSGCASDIQEGTVVQKIHSTTTGGNPVCTLMVLEDRQPHESESEQEHKKPEAIEVDCGEKFEAIKIGDHWKKENTP